MVNWITEHYLGQPPVECAQNPAFSACYAQQVAQAIKECTSSRHPGMSTDDCSKYYADLYAYQNCKKDCPSLTAPVKPAPPGGETTTAKKTTSSNAGLIILGVIGATALAVALSR